MKIKTSFFLILCLLPVWPAANSQANGTTMETYRKAVTERPKDAEAQRLRGDSYRELGKYRQAIKTYQEILRIHPEDTATYLRVGIAYFKLKSYPEAIAELQQCLRLDPQNGSAHVYLGMAYNVRGGAHDPVKEGLRTPGNGDYIEDDKRAVRENPNDPNSHYILGNSYVALGWYP